MGEGICIPWLLVYERLQILFPSVMNLRHILHQEFPEDPTGRFDDFKYYVESELNMCKWLAVLIVLAQVYIIMKT